MQPVYTYVLFDLDGTLTDSEEGIINSFQYGLRAFGIEENDPAILRTVIGPALYNSYHVLFGLPEEQATEAVALFRQQYEAAGKFESHPYEGIIPLLSNLKASGCRVILATAKPEHFANQILEHFDLAHYFEYVCGADDDANRIEKDEIIGEIMRVYPEINPQNTIMIGDRKYDVLGAAACGLDCIGVLYGFGGRSELEEAGTKYLAESVQALSDFLLK